MDFIARIVVTIIVWILFGVLFLSPPACRSSVRTCSLSCDGLNVGLACLWTRGGHGVWLVHR